MSITIASPWGALPRDLEDTQNDSYSDDRREQRRDDEDQELLELRERWPLP
jgi:hypothetical protein